MEIEMRKQQIIEWLGANNDANLLLQIEAIIASEKESDESRWNTLTVEEQEGIDKALKGLDEGKGLSNEAAWSRINGKLGLQE